MTIPMNQLEEILGNTLIDSDGDKIGKVSEIYLDRATSQPEWIATHTGLFGTNLSFVPMQDAMLEGNDVRVPFSKDQVKNAPNIDADGSLSPEQEAELYRHYNMTYDDSAMDDMTDMDETSTGTTGYDTSGPTTDDAMTRSEEEMSVGTERYTTGRARLKKYIVTEQRNVTVPVSHEEVRMVTEPITEANADAAYSGPDLSEEEHEVVLHAEEPVVTKQTVAKERVRLDTETVTEQQEVSADLRKEQIELDTDADAKR